MLGRHAYKYLGSCWAPLPAAVRDMSLRSSGENTLFSGKNKTRAERAKEIESNKCPAWIGLINSKIDLFSLL